MNSAGTLAVAGWGFALVWFLAWWWAVDRYQMMEAIAFAERRRAARIARAHRAPAGVPQSDYDQACADIEQAICSPEKEPS